MTAWLWNKKYSSISIHVWLSKFFSFEVLLNMVLQILQKNKKKNCNKNRKKEVIDWKLFFHVKYLYMFVYQVISVIDTVSYSN